MRVRRETGGGTGDDDEADVAYDSNNILSLDSAISNASAGVTATTLGEFINVGEVNSIVYSNPDSLTVTASCFVDTWYDQANSNDAEQTTQGRQPQIHDGTADTDLILENGKPAVEFGDDDQITTPFNTSSSDFDLPQTMVLATRYLTGGSFNNFNFMVCSGGSSAFGKFEMFTQPGGGTTTQLRTGSGAGTVASVNVSDHTSTAMYLQFGIWGSSNMKMSYNGGSIVTGDATNSNDHTITALALGSSAVITGTFRTAEWIIWPTDQDADSNRTDIEDNINAEFGIY